MIVTLLIAQIHLQTPWAVAAPEVARAVDRPAAQDGRGQAYVPTTSLAGSLRAHLRAQGVAVELMGAEPPEDRGDILEPSPLRLCGTTVTATTADVVQQTAVDRRRGAAKDRMLRTSQVHRPGAVVTVYLRFDGELAASHLEILAAWKPRVGGGKSRGQGQGHLAALRWGHLDLSTPDGLAAWLGGGGHDLHDRVCLNDAIAPGAAETPDTPWIHARLRIVDGLLTAAPKTLLKPDTAEREPDAVPLRRGDELTIEGSSLRGLLRHRVAYILASLGQEICGQGDASADAQVDGCGQCSLCELFGSTQRASAVGVRSATLDATDHDLRVRPHVAIDRVTGGAADGLLFSEQHVRRGEFDLTIDLLRDDDCPAWGRAVLLLAIRDLHDGMIGVGSRVTRGLGTVELIDPSLLDELADDTDTGMQAFRELVGA